MEKESHLWNDFYRLSMYWNDNYLNGHTGSHPSIHPFVDVAFFATPLWLGSPSFDFNCPILQLKLAFIQDEIGEK